MFGSNGRGRDTGGGFTSAAASPVGGGKRGMFSVIGPDVTITGNIAATADLHIDGRIHGDVQCGNLVQGTESAIHGSVRADVARLAGAIEGSVSVRQLTVERTARITGDVEYEGISIETGAAIDGRMKHLSADAVSRQHDRPVPALTHDTSLVSETEEAA